MVLLIGSSDMVWTLGIGTGTVLHTFAHCARRQALGTSTARSNTHAIYLDICKLDIKSFYFRFFERVGWDGIAKKLGGMGGEGIHRRSVPTIQTHRHVWHPFSYLPARPSFLLRASNSSTISTVSIFEAFSPSASSIVILVIISASSFKSLSLNVVDLSHDLYDLLRNTHTLPSYAIYAVKRSALIMLVCFYLELLPHI
jgi:hypothetical protein